VTLPQQDTAASELQGPASAPCAHGGHDEAIAASAGPARNASASERAAIRAFMDMERYQASRMQSMEITFAFAALEAQPL
jgi:hypothetical protein